MNKTLIAASLASTLGALAPAHAESFTDSATVLSSRPITERIPVNREECWNEQRRGYDERRITRQDNGAPIGAGTVLGAIAGGVIGHQFGNSSGGRDRGTAAGAVIGGLVGNQIERDQRGGETVEVERVPVTRDVQRCRTVGEVREVPAGFEVRYRYAGRDFVTRMPSEPGRRVRIAVDVQPVAEGYGPGPERAAPPGYGPGPDRPAPPGYSR